VQFSWRACHTFSADSLVIATCLLRRAIGFIMVLSRLFPHLAQDVPFTSLYAAIISYNNILAFSRSYRVLLSFLGRMDIPISTLNHLPVAAMQYIL